MGRMTGLAIDCHGHFTTEPPELRAFRTAQVAFAEGRSQERPDYPGAEDETLRDVIGSNQLRLQQERGSDLTILSPRASGMGHHVPGQEVATEWARLSNDTIKRICDLFPSNFAGVCQLPQTIDGELDPVIEELERCVAAGSVGCNLNPDPSGGRWSAPPIHDPWWDPLWETMTRLDVPAMIHVSGSCTRSLHTTGAHYLAADTAVFMQLVEGDLFERHPELRLIIPHGGGAAPYHWGRYRGLAMMLGKAPLPQHVMQNVFFDTCVYHQAGVDLLFSVIDSRNILFGSELLGAVRATDPETGHDFDDTLRYIDALGLDEQTRHAVFEGNARRVYPRLDALLTAQGR
jgi:4-oxalmesaconate hydratase